MQPLSAVRILSVAKGQIIWLKAQTGCVWLTCEGRLEDFFLKAGESLHFTGPARLYLAAEGAGAACLLWTREARPLRRSAIAKVPTEPFVATDFTHSLPL